MLKVDLHTHSGDDPQDRIRYSSLDLIDRAARLGFQALAITNHNAITLSPELSDHAAARDILLLPGVEITAEGCHVLVINPEFPVSPHDRFLLSDIPRLRTPGSLFIAPHPYFVIFQSLGKRVEALLPYFDAIELGSYFNRLIDFNRPARRLAARSGKPLIATSDCHTVRAVRPLLFPDRRGKERAFHHRGRQGRKARAPGHPHLAGHDGLHRPEPVLLPQAGPAVRTLTNRALSPFLDNHNPEARRIILFG